MHSSAPARLSALLGLAFLLAGCGGERAAEPAPTGPQAVAPGEPERGKPERRQPERRRPARDRFPGPRNARSARVTGVTDGDTISLSAVGRVRLIGVDTPEVFGGAECYGRQASAFARRLLPEGRRVRYRLGVEQRDRYGRALAYVWLADGRMLNGLLAERGYAQPLTIPPNVDYAELFVAAACRARRAARGLWGVRGCAVSGRDTRGGSRDGGPGGGGADRTCSDFATEAEAQRHFERSGGSRGSADRLDGDGNGRACEALP